MTKARKATALPQRVVGVGASAGGLDALRQLVSRIPLDTGLAVVVLQHLPPSQTGQLAALLAKSTELPVINAASGHRIKPNTIVVVPPHTSASMFRGALVLRKAKPGKRPYLPIDALFGSLASALGERAVGVILSGTAHDGTEGLRAIRASGGLTFAQDPSTAQFDEMPRSAIAEGVAEIVLAPALIGEELGTIASAVPRPAVSARSAAGGMEQILEQLREASGIDFTSYKRSTIERRLARRLSKLHLATLEEYSAYLAEHHAEARAVYEDLLIHVTEFFRDRESLDKLVAHMVSELLRDRPADAPVRVWVPGCSTGEEVYSLAILLLERLGDRQLQLFGSDLSEKAIETARIGRYPASIAKQVGARRLERFFHREDGSYRINKDVRERCVFVRHDLVTDPPFSKLDLISCRNLLIYLGPPLQRRVIPIFHYALNQPGYLLLGRAEAISSFETLFATVDAESRIYSRKPAARTMLTFPIAGQLGRQPWRRPTDLLRTTLDVQRDVDHVLLARYTPACVLVDENLDVVQFRGRTGAFLEQPPGQPQLNLLRMARDGLAAELPVAIQHAQRTDAPIRRENVIVRDRNHDRRIHLEVVPVRGIVDSKRHFLVVFEEVTDPPASRVRKQSKKHREPDELVRVRQELAATKEYLHSVVTQHLATSEELGITNEELQSANEELQSSNEELQTAKEELQSTNEELETVNEELQRGNELLREANDDLVNVLASVDIAIIIVDTDRRVRRFTPKSRSVMKLIPGDIGRPIRDLQPSVAVPMLDTLIATVIETLESHESEVRHPDGAWYRLQIQPYRTADHKVSGAVIAFVDITALRIAREFPAAIVEAVPTPLVVIDERLRVRSANAAFCAAFTVTEPAISGRELIDVGEWRTPAFRARLDALVATGTGFDDLELEYKGQGGDRMLRLGARPMPALEGRRLFLIAIADVTERRRLRQVREAAQRERDSFLDAVSHELRTPLSAIILWAQALRGFAPDDPLRLRAIDTILESARSEAHLIDDLMELALSRTTELSVKVESIEPASIVQAAVDAARAVATAKKVAIKTELVPGPRIDADPRRLQQIASNLITNAVKFTPSGGQVSVSLGHANGSIELRVRDTGPGIAPEFLAHAFDPFTQADASSTREHSGLGIGLALVRHFVERQGGTIDVSSPGPGQGTTFAVHLPATPTGK